MLETLAVALVLLWLLGLVSAYTLGVLIHLLLVIAVLVVLVAMSASGCPKKYMPHFSNFLFPLGQAPSTLPMDQRIRKPWEGHRK